MSNLKQYAKFIEICKKHKLEMPEKSGQSLKIVIDDIIFDVQNANKIITARIYDAAKLALQATDMKLVKVVSNDFATWLNSNRNNLVESVVDVIIDTNTIELPSSMQNEMFVLEELLASEDYTKAKSVFNESINITCKQIIENNKLNIELA